jgi:hypothetical protein
MAAIATPNTFRTFNPPRWHEAEPDIFVKRSAIPLGALAAEAHTLGWDTVNAIRLPVVNQTLSESSLYPKTFDLTVQDSPKWVINGTFSAWSLVRGGSGAIVFLRAPMPTGKMTFEGTPDLNFADGWVTIQIKLQYLPQPPASPTKPRADDASPAQPQYLVRDETARTEDDPAVVIQAIDFGDATVTPLQDALFRAALSTWFNKNLAIFTYVFTVVNINAVAAQGQFQWLKPTYTSYAYLNGATDESSYFGVLNMTQNNSAEGLTNQMPASAIPDGATASLLISNESFLRNMVLPGLSKSFPNTTASSFFLTGNDQVIENVGPIQMEDEKIGAIYYTPIMESFTFQVVGDEIQVNSLVKVKISAGIHAFVNGTYYSKIKLVQKPNNGGYTLDFVQSREPKVNFWSEQSDGVVITSILVGVLGGVFSFIGGAWASTLVRRLVAVIIIGIVMGLAAALPSIIAAVMDGKAAEALPSIGDLVESGVGDIKWPMSTGFAPVSVELNGSLQIGGLMLYAAG